MKGIILAAGKGSRIAELNLIHKSFAVVKKKHIIDYSLDLLVGDDISHPLVSEIIIVVGYHAEEIINYVGNSYKEVPVKYVYQNELKGVAHAMLVARESINDDVIMCLADEILLNPKLRQMIEYYRINNLNCVCGVVVDGNDYSGKPIAYDVTKENDIVEVREKASLFTNDYRGIGECIFGKKALDLLDQLKPNEIRGEYEMGNWEQLIIKNLGKIKTFVLADAYVNINYAKDIDAANALLRKTEE